MQAEDIGYYTVLLLKELLIEAYGALTQQLYPKATYFYRHAYVGKALFEPDDHSKFAYCLNKVNNYE